MLTRVPRFLMRSHARFQADGPRPQVLVACEDLNMALRAISVMGLIAKEAGDVLDIQFSMWRFDSFNSPYVRELVARHAQEADIVVVAPVSSRSGLSTPFTSWLDLWTGCRQRQPSALVAVFDPTDRQRHAKSVVRRQLRAVAGSAGMDFFCGAPRQLDPSSAGRRGRLGVMKSARGSKKPTPNSQEEFIE